MAESPVKEFCPKKLVYCAICDEKYTIRVMWYATCNILLWYRR